MTYLVEFSKSDNNCVAEEIFIGTFLGVEDFAKNYIANSDATKAQIYRLYSVPKFEKEIR